MSISNSYPTQRPKLNLVFNGGSDQLDSRISYTRSSSGTAFSAERHLSSENFLKYSNDLSNADWNKARVTVGSTNNTAPDGSSTASSVLETAVTDTHTFYDQYTSVAGVSYTHTVFAKANGRTKFKLYTRDANATFDLTAVTATTTGMDAVSVTAIGSTGWYKCVATEAATNTLGILQIELMDGTATNYAGDVTKGMYFWGMQASSTGETVLNATSGSIHREFAPTLKTAAADAPRFEYASDGQSVGLLIEAQATNLQRYGSDFASWGEVRYTTVTSNSGIAPNGLLEADLAVPNSESQLHYVYDTAAVIASGTTYTGSVYVKKTGHRYIQMTASTANFGNNQWATFDLDDGSIDANNVTASAESVGNGWWRIQTTMTSIAAGTGGMAITFANTATGAIFPTISGNDFSGILLWGWQLETGSSASSLVDTGTGSSQLSRAADSCSVDLSDINFVGGEVTLVADTNTSAIDDYRQAASLIDDSQNQVTLYGNSYNNRLVAILGGGESSILSQTSANGISALSFGVNDLAATRNGASPVTDTSQAFPNVSAGNLKIGGSGSSQILNGTIKRIALYNVALSDTELQAITS